MLKRKEPGAMAPGIAANAPVVLWYRVERTSSRAGVAPAGVQRLSRRTFSPTTRIFWKRTERRSITGIRWMLRRLLLHLLKKGIHVERQARLGNSHFHPFHRYRGSDPEDSLVEPPILFPSSQSVSGQHLQEPQHLATVDNGANVGSGGAHPLY